ncbi:hypothetical protein P12x_002235 [Tundrisphaera lichenicola]|uniref:hypothetical protein n=1 Tax=Tundrisphaera lichenicola TaxID=2029860 RepID=UPI003EB6D255
MHYVTSPFGCHTHRYSHLPDGSRLFNPSFDPRKLDMFYSVASPDWKSGQPLNPVGALLFRSRSEAEAFAPDSPTVAVAVRFDQEWRIVRPQGSVAQSVAGSWSAPAVGNALGGVTVFGPIPAGLVRSSANVETLADWRPRVLEEAPAGHSVGFGGWDSLTMALLA